MVGYLLSVMGPSFGLELGFIGDGTMSCMIEDKNKAVEDALDFVKCTVTSYVHSSLNNVKWQK